MSGQVDLQNARSAVVRLSTINNVLRVEAVLDNGLMMLADATLVEAKSFVPLFGLQQVRRCYWAC